jgi:23S rRNA (adenine2503-C2)-methyltransferase
MNKTNLLGLTAEELSDFFEEMGESRYRGRQIFQWLYEKGVGTLGDVTVLGKSLRDELQSIATIAGITPVTRQQAGDGGTTKFLFALTDGARIESVLIPPASAFRDAEADDDEQKRLTLCVSTQVGCPLDCSFCATATMGFIRNLDAGEIVDQVREVRRSTGKRITNVVFMGMGEPMMNYDNVMKAAGIMTAGMEIAARRITVSTAGWADKIRQMGDEQQRVKLAVSLHSVDERTRTMLMPITKRFGLDVLLSAIEHYYSCTRQRVTYEYIFFDGINDSDADVRKLITFARRVPCKINVIPFHAIDHAGTLQRHAALRRSPRADALVNRLRDADLSVFVRSSAGETIDAACGQLAVRTGKGHPSLRSDTIHAPAAEHSAGAGHARRRVVRP